MTRRRTTILFSMLAMAFWVVASGLAAQRAAASVTLQSFTAMSVDGDPTVFVEWVTATELDTAGFYLARSITDTAGSFKRISQFIPAQGDPITGWTYPYPDETTQSNITYYYVLEVINSDQTIDLHGPISVIAGVAATPESMNTPTSTPTATLTPGPTAKPTRTPRATPMPTNTPVINLTPSVLLGETITPQPSGSGAAQLPTQAASGTRIAMPGIQPSTVQPTPTGTPAGAPLSRLIPLTAIADAPALMPTDPTVVAIAPVVISTQAVDDAPLTASSPDSLFLLIIVAALLLIGGLYTVLRQAGK